MYNEFGIKYYKGKWTCTAKTLYSEKTLIGRLQQYFLIYFETFSVPTADTLFLLILSILSRTQRFQLSEWTLLCKYYALHTCMEEWQDEIYSAVFVLVPVEYWNKLLWAENLLVTLQLYGTKLQGYWNAGKSDQYLLLCNDKGFKTADSSASLLIIKL